MRRLATLTLLCAPSATSGAIPSIAPRMELVGCDRCLEAADAWEVNECFPEKE